MADWYLEDKRRLQGQPKRTIGDYVESQGILVPRRFNSLANARASGLPIIARSEHEQDYAGASGLLKSCDLQFADYRTISDERELERVILAEPDFGTTKFKQWCRFSRLNVDQTKQEVSFSFWEMIGGFNRMIVADSAIGGRYHITTYGKGFNNYTIVDLQKGNEERITQFTPELREGLNPLIELYEKIRTLGRFDARNCPIVEIQTAPDGKNYFLQYHRTRDFCPSEFVLERAPIKGEIKVPFVRGATAQEGMDCKVTVYYSGQDRFKFNSKDEDGSWDIHWNHVFPELRARKRKVQMLGMKGNNLDWEFLKLVAGHMQRSKLFKPQVSIISRMSSYLNKQTVTQLYNITKTGQNAYMNLHILSDGRKAFVRRME